MVSNIEKPRSVRYQSLRVRHLRSLIRIVKLLEKEEINSRVQLEWDCLKYSSDSRLDISHSENFGILANSVKNLLNLQR